MVAVSADDPAVLYGVLSAEAVWNDVVWFCAVWFAGLFVVEPYAAVRAVCDALVLSCLEYVGAPSFVAGGAGSAGGHVVLR